MLLRAAFIVLLCILPLLAKADNSPNVQEAIDVIITFCVAGGKQSKVEFGGGAGVELSLRKFDATGGAKGEIKISKSEARGLVDGLNEKLNEYGSKQASEARECMKPYIDQILKFILGTNNFELAPMLPYVIVDAWQGIREQFGYFKSDDECLSALVEAKHKWGRNAANCVRLPDKAWCITTKDGTGSKVIRTCNMSKEACDMAYNLHYMEEQIGGERVMTLCEQISSSQLIKN